jgi:hypothetical protein
MVSSGEHIMIDVEHESENDRINVRVNGVNDNEIIEGNDG